MTVNDVLLAAVARALAVTPSAPRSARATSRRCCRVNVAPTAQRRVRRPHHVHVRRAARLRCRPVRAPAADRDATRSRKESACPRTPTPRSRHCPTRRGPCRRRPPTRSPAGVYNLVVSNIPAADPDVHGRLRAARRLPGGAAVGAPRAVGRDDDDRRPRLLQLLADPEALPDSDALADDLDARWTSRGHH